ncbi:MAG TPA: capreomycidine synthase [Thermoanaerobaculia bacterium]
MSDLRLPPALLEEWMRSYYFEAEIDIGSSGVEDYSLGELRELLGISQRELDEVVFHDSRTLGNPELRAAIARRWAAGEVDQVIVTHGATEANYLVMNSLLERDDEVLVLDPLYQQLHSIAGAIGCKLARLPLRFEHGFAPDLEEAGALIGPRTRMIVVNFPHNPTGVTVTVEQQRELIRLAARVGAYLVWDLAFGELTYERPPLPSPGLLYERAISMGTLSKAYGLPGLRLGWCIAAPEVLARFVRLRDYLTLHLSPLVELVARRAIESAEVLLAPRLQQAARNRRRVEDWMSDQEGRASWVRPAAGVCAFPRLEGVPDVDDFCRRLLVDDGVLLVPGSCFGLPRHVRLGFGGASRDLEEGLRRLGEALRRTAS